MGVAPKKIKRRLKKSARRTIAALLLVTAIIVAAIPVQDLSAGDGSASTGASYGDFSLAKFNDDYDATSNNLYRTASDPNNDSLKVENYYTSSDDFELRTYGYLINQDTGVCELDSQYHLPIPLYYIDYFNSGYSPISASVAGFNDNAIYTITNGVLPFYNKMGFDSAAHYDTALAKNVGTIFQTVTYKVPVVFTADRSNTIPEGLTDPPYQGVFQGETINADGTITKMYHVVVRFDQFGNKYLSDGTMVDGTVVKDPVPDASYPNVTSEITTPYTCDTGRQALITCIADNALKEKTNFSKLAIPTFISKIGNESFKGCTALTTASFESGLQSIGTMAFAECGNLGSVDFAPSNSPSACATLGVGAFGNCYTLSSFEFPSGIKKCRFSGTIWM